MSGARTGRSRRLASDATELVRELARGGVLNEIAERVVSGSLAGPSSIASGLSIAARQIRTAAVEVESVGLRGGAHVKSSGAARTSCRGVGAGGGSLAAKAGETPNAVRRLGEVLRSCHQQPGRYSSVEALRLVAGPRGLGGSVAVRQLLQQVTHEVLFNCSVSCPVSVPYCLSLSCSAGIALTPGWCRLNLLQGASMLETGLLSADHAASFRSWVVISGLPYWIRVFLKTSELTTALCMIFYYGS